jgi:Glycosyl transferase family 2
VAFALCERWIRAQTRQPDEWIVADGGGTPAVPTMGQVHLYAPGVPGAANFRENLLRGLAAVSGDVVVFVEDDDYYAPRHLERIVAQVTAPGVGIAGDDQQRYYNLPQRCWRVFQNRGASLCQTAIRRDAIPFLERAIRYASRIGGGYGVDGALWEDIPAEFKSLERTQTVTGIKGLPGRSGLGIGHRPNGGHWTPDRDGSRLRAWLGADADVYLTGVELAACR